MAATISAFFRNLFSQTVAFFPAMWYNMRYKTLVFPKCRQYTMLRGEKANLLTFPAWQGGEVRYEAEKT